MSRPIVLKSLSTTSSSSSSRPTRWGIMGAGQISNDWAVGISTLNPAEHKLVAVATRNVTSAQEFATRHQIPSAYGSYQELATDPEVGRLHRYDSSGTLASSQAKLALDNGKHVLCEKPLCMNVKETTELVNYARAKNLFLMEAVWSRFFPAYAKLREIIDSGKIGDVKQVVAELGFGFPEDNWRRAKELGGGSVLDMGTYTSQLATFVFKGLKPEKIVGAGHLNGTGADDSSSTTLVFPGGKTATLLTHTVVTLSNEATIIGTEGTLKLRAPFWCPTELETEEGLLKFPVPSSDKKLNFPNGTGLAYESEEVRRCLVNGLTESPQMTWDETILLAEIRETIRKQIGVAYPTD